MDKQITSEEEFNQLLRLLPPNNEAISTLGKTIENKIFNERFFYDNSSITLSFKNCTFQEKFSLVNYQPNADSYFTDCEFLDDIFLWKVNTEKKFSFLNCTIRRKLIFSTSKIDTFQLNNHFCDTILFDENSSFKIIEIGGKQHNKIDNITLPAKIIEDKCTINQANILKFRSSYSTLENQLNIFNCNINFLELDNFRNNGSLRFLNCQAQNFDSMPSQFLISRSNLGKAEFYNFDFASFQRVNIVNSVLLESLYISSNWTSNIVSIDPYTQPPVSTKSDLPKRIYASVIREVYKQIKFAMSKQGNFIEEQYFHGLEMNAYDISLSFKNSFWTKSILKLSHWTSNYGQSFLRPLLTIALINIPLLILLEYQLGFRIISINKITWQDSFEPIANFLWFMNPIHKNDPELKGLPLILDIVIRIVSSYSIYNLIRASRRFIK